MFGVMFGIPTELKRQWTKETVGTAMRSLPAELLPSGTSEALFHALSPRIRLPSAAADLNPPTPPASTTHATTASDPDQTISQLPLFHSLVLERASSHASASVSPAGQQLSHDIDVTLNAGGLVWGVEFCPHLDPADTTPSTGTTGSSSSSSSSGAKRELLAIAAHPAGVTRNKAGQVLQGPGCVQIWALPGSTQSTAPAAGSRAGASARMVMCIVHEGCVTWGLKWCPQPRRVFMDPLTLTEPQQEQGQTQGQQGQGQEQGQQGQAAALDGLAGAGGAAAAAAGSAADEASEGEELSLQPPLKKPRGARPRAAAPALPGLGPTTAGPAHRCLHTVGILALVLGSAEVQVLSVPEPDELHSAAGALAAAGGGRQGAAAAPEAVGNQAAGGTAAAAAAAEPQVDAGAAAAAPAVAAPAAAPAVRLRCQYLIDRDMLGGSVPCSLEWQNTRPRAAAGEAATAGGAGGRGGAAVEGPGAEDEALLLLVGCCDGMVAGWRIPCTATQQLHCVFQAQADGSPVWSLRWCPDSAVFDSVDQLQANTFMTVSHAGILNMWDIRDLALPIQKHLLSRSPCRSACWVTEPVGVVSVHEDGALRQLYLDPVFHSLTKDMQLTSSCTAPDQGCVWSCSYSAPLSCVLYCGDDGVAAIMLVQPDADPRKRLPHVPIGGCVRRDEVLWLLSHEEVAGAPCVYQGGSVFAGRTGGVARGRGAPRSSATFKDELQVLYTCAMSPNASQGCCWLAYGGRAGLVRCQRICFAQEQGRGKQAGRKERAAAADDDAETDSVEEEEKGEGKKASEKKGEGKRGGGKRGRGRGRS